MINIIFLAMEIISIIIIIENSQRINNRELFDQIIQEELIIIIKVIM